MSNGPNMLDEVAKFIFTSKYARYIPELKRRETWEEAVTRVEQMHLRKFDFLESEVVDEIHWAFDMVRAKRVLPSMRAIEVSTPLPTPFGWVVAGEVKPGQMLFDENGNQTKVIAIQRFKDKELYDVIFSDGSKVRTCGEHLWRTSTIDDRVNSKKYGKRITRDITTEEIKNSLFQKSGTKKYPFKYNHVVWNHDPIDIPDIELPIDPYILGLWLGDGYSASGQFACHQDDIEIINSYTNSGFDAHKVSNNPHLWGTYGLETLLRKNNFINNKNIPELYLRSGYTQRLALIQGLMDSDGHTDKKGRSSFTNTRKNLIDGFCELISLFGIKYTIETKLAYENKQEIYTIRFHTSIPIHRISRKLNRIRKNLRASNGYRSIVDVKKVGIGEAICYVVDSPQRTYLVGKNMITTHNSLQFGGLAIEKKHAKIYNCAVSHVHSIRSFAEIFYLLLCGNGVGIGLGSKYLNRLPNLVGPDDKTGTVITYVIEDTIEGWADSIEALLNCYFINTAFSGRRIIFDYSKIRKEGSILKTGGGKAPGYKGLKEAHIKIKSLLDRTIEAGHIRLRSIDAYDILMHTSDAVLSGGVRRSATIVIFDFDDKDMLNAKLGNWFEENPQRARSNNSVRLLRTKVSQLDFLGLSEFIKEWGEPGFYWADDEDSLINPCAEINFIPVTEDGVCGVQFCNLTTINGSKVTTREEFLEAAKAASIIGTLQATYTDFPYLSNTAKFLTEQEALLGVSITAMMDNPDILFDETNQQLAANRVNVTNAEIAFVLGINRAARTTCIKPEGTSTLALGSMASGIHPAHSHKMFRRIQANKQDNVYNFLKSFNSHICEPSVWSANHTDDIVTFPIELDPKVITKSHLSAKQHLDMILLTQKNWVAWGTTFDNKKKIKHSVSCTVVVQPDEWQEVLDYIFENKNLFTAVSLISSTGDKDYKQAPMEAVVTEEDNLKFEYYMNNFISINYEYMQENEDGTTLMQELACAGAQGCDIR